MDDASQLAIQLYSLREAGNLERQLDIAQAAGFGAVETIQSHLEDAQAMKSALDRRGFAAPSGHVSLPALRERMDWVLSGARTLGMSWIVLPALPMEMRDQDEAGWRATGAELNQIAARIADAGFKFGYHNHAWELKALSSGAMPLDLLLESGSKVAWQADVAWLMVGGADPVEWLNRYRDRVASVHVKDIAAEGKSVDEDGWADVGHGTMDWQALWALCQKIGVSLMIAEHDKPNDGERFAKRSFATMASLAKGHAA